MIAFSHHFSLFGNRSSRRSGQSSTPGFLAQVDGWVERRRQRRALLALNDHALKDIGLSRADAWEEGHKPFWRG